MINYGDGSISKFKCGHGYLDKSGDGLGSGSGRGSIFLNGQGSGGTWGNGFIFGYGYGKFGS